MGEVQNVLREKGVELIGIENICLAALGRLIRREVKGWRLERKGVRSWLNI